jgi:glutamate/aspartate transport system substrate-binding protein
MRIAAGRDHPESFLMVETGRAVAYANDDVLLASHIASAKTPGDYEISKEALSVEPYAIMMRRGDPAFKAAVDGALAKVYKSDDINRIYNKWFMTAIPPRNINLNFPMSAELKAAFAKPTDSGDPAAYAVVPAAQAAASKKK